MPGNRSRIPKAIIVIVMVFLAFIGLDLATAGNIQPRYGNAQISPEPTPIQITKELARLAVEPKIQEIWQLSVQAKGLRALQYQELLPPATEVKPAFGMGVAPQKLTCENSCWLFFIDKAPGAHFAHPVTIILVDAVTGDQKTMDTEWWPEVSGPNTEKKQLFKTVEMRTNPELIIFEQIPIIIPGIQQQSVVPSLSLDANPLSDPLTCDGCIAWAIIVCGYDDLPDTFDEDTNGIYNVLKTLGLSDDHIFYLSPHDDPGVDRPTSKANVQWATQQVAGEACGNDKVLFFYSSHGGVDGVTCIDVGISASELDSWLDPIDCKEMAIIIEACHSGSFIGKYKDGTYVAAEDDLTNAAESRRVVFTSASTDTSSYPDKDGPDDPNESTDIGSESIYGYIMAFGDPVADTNGDGAVSFEEGVQYALINDVTLIRGDNTPQFSNTADLDPAKVHHYCYPTSDPNGPYSEACIDGEAEFPLDGSGSFAPPPCDGLLTYSWDTNCPGATFSDSSAISPILTLSPINQCVNCQVWLTVTCSDGSSETRLSTVTTTDSTAPSIACPANTTISCETSEDPSSTGSATANDNCDLSPAIKFSDLITPGTCPNAETITRTWTAADGCGNTASCEQTINVVDLTPPSITCPADMTVECDQPTDPSNTGTATAVDNCDESPLLGHSDSETPGKCPQERTISRTWTATDSCGNESSCAQTIEVLDTTPPVIQNVSASPDALWAPNHKMVQVNVSATAIDNCDSSPDCAISSVSSNEPVNGLGDGDKAPDWIITGDLSLDLRAERSGTGTGRIYTIIVTCTDECGNSTVGTASVTVQHNQ